MFMMVIAHVHEGCFQLQEELDFRLYEAVLLFAGTQQVSKNVVCTFWEQNYTVCGADPHTISHHKK